MSTAPGAGASPSRFSISRACLWASGKPLVWMPTRGELLEIRYINWDWWLRISNGTRLPRVAVEVQGRDDGDRTIAAAVATNPELIVVTDPEQSRLVLLEGHVRLTAYAAFPEYLPAELELYLGTSPTVADWSEF